MHTHAFSGLFCVNRLASKIVTLYAKYAFKCWYSPLQLLLMDYSIMFGKPMKLIKN